MKRLSLNRFYGLVASPKLTLTLLCLFGIAIATATFIESARGTAAAQAYVYNARWFEIVLALFALNLLFALRRWWPFRPRVTGFALIHISVIVILLGAAVTRFFGFEGTMFVREGQSSDIIYSREKHIQLFWGGESASFPVRLHREGEQGIRRNLELKGRTFRIDVGLFVPARTGDLEGGEKRPAEVAVLLTDDQGNSISRTLVESMRDRAEFLLGDHHLGLGYGPAAIQLPHRVQLDDFVLVTYPGSDNPVDFESHVRLFDPDRGIEGRPARIYMNHPLSHRGFKHFQSSYDNDRRGTVLTVNFDPGKIPTYLGYGLISLGFILVFAKDLIWPSRRTPAASRESSP